MDVDHGQLVYPSLKDCPVVVGLDNLAPVGGRATGRQDWRRLERFAEVWLLYPLLILCGVAILYSLVIMLAAATILPGRNQRLYDFWFYLTNFSRYPAEIYAGPWGGPIRTLCTFVIPILLVVNVPARVIARPLSGESWSLVAAALIAAATALLISQLVFQAALAKYRSASS